MAAKQRWKDDEQAAIPVEADQPTEPPVPAEAVYSREDLMAGAAGFGVRPEVIAGALRLAGKSSATRREMEAAIRAFMTREVKA